MEKRSKDIAKLAKQLADALEEQIEHGENYVFGDPSDLHLSGYFDMEEVALKLLQAQTVSVDSN